MMTGPEHYAESERLLERIKDEAIPVTTRDRLTALASIHATLAVAAFTSAPVTGEPLWIITRDES